MNKYLIEVYERVDISTHEKFDTLMNELLKVEVKAEQEGIVKLEEYFISTLPPASVLQISLVGGPSLAKWATGQRS